MELSQRAKVIEELKLTLSIFIDKYNEIKKQMEKERNFSLTVSMNSFGSKNIKIERTSLQILGLTGKSQKKESANIKPLRKLSSKKEIIKENENKLTQDNLNLNLNLQILNEQIKQKDTLISNLQNEIQNIQKFSESQIENSAREKMEYEQKMQININELTEIKSALQKKEIEFQENLLKKEEELKHIHILFQQKNEIFQTDLSKEKKVYNILSLHFENIKSESYAKDNLISLLQSDVDNLKKQIEKFNEDHRYVIDSHSNEIQKKESAITNLNLQLCESVTTLKNFYENKINENEKVYLGKISSLKEGLVKLYENTNAMFLLFEKKYQSKLKKLKAKIESIKSKLSIHVNCNKEKQEERQKEIQTMRRNTIAIITQKEESLQATIDKLETEKGKLLFRLSNTERLLKENEKKNIVLINGNSKVVEQLNHKQDLMSREYNKILEKYKEEIEKEREQRVGLSNKASELEKTLGMYMIENQGKSKIIDERNEEIRRLKEENSVAK